MNNEKKTSVKNKGSFKGFFKQRSTRRGAVSIAFTVLFIAAVFLCNVVLSAVTDRHPLYLDTTENATYRLQQETIDFLSAVDAPVDIYVLSKESTFEDKNSTDANYKYLVQANRLFHAMESTGKNIQLHYIDLVSDPSFQSTYPKVNWSESHLLLIQSGEMYQALDFDDLFTYDYSSITGQQVEQSVMGAILNVTTTEKTTVTVITGQGEEDLSGFISTLENNAFEVETVTMPGGTISKKSEFVILFAPDIDIDETTYNTLTKWLKNDGKYGHHIFYMPRSDQDPKNFPHINEILADSGMELDFSYIIDTAYITSYEDYYQSRYDYADDTTYTEDLRNKDIPVVMTATMPVNIIDSSIAKPLLLTSESAMSQPQTEGAEMSDETQVFNGAAIGTYGTSDEGKNSSVVVVGSPFAFLPRMLASANNAAYFVNLFHTLADHEGVNVVIEGKDPTAKTLGLSEQTSYLSTLRTYFWILVIGIPAAVLAIGVIIWLRRRHK